MTVAELMRIADAYAVASAAFHLAPSAESAQSLQDARAALEEALSMTSQFGGLL